MNLRTLAVAITMIASTPANPVSGQSRPAEVESDPIPGAWALQFRITGNFTLSDFQGGAISGKYHLSRSSAVRLGLSASGQVSDLEQSTISELSTLFPGDPAFDNESDRTAELNRDRTAYSLGLDAQYVIYPNPADPMKLFVGVGQTMRYERSELDDSGSDFRLDESTDGTGSATTESSRHEERDTWAFGGLALLGAEWFASSRISLSAEYGLSLEYLRTSQELNFDSIQITESIPGGNRVQSNTSFSDTRDDGWRFGSPTVRFGLNVYF